MSRLRFYDRPTRPPSIIAAVGTVLIASLLMTAPAIAAGTPATVAVSSVTELEAAITDGVGTVLIEPGDYVVDGSILLEDMDLIGTAEGVVFS